MAGLGGLSRKLSVDLPQTQLPLDGGRKLRFANFVAGGNAAAVAALRDWLESPDADICVLEGPAGCGKTHLLQAAIDWWRGTQRPLRYVPLGTGAQLPPPADLPEGLVAVDDLQHLAAEQALGLTRAIDAARDGRWRLLLATQVPVADLELPFEDLRSRLQWGASLSLKPLDEAGVARVLTLRAEELGVSWSERNTDYLLRRVPRDPRVVLDIFAAAYRRAVAERRPISVPSQLLLMLWVEMRYWLTQTLLTASIMVTRDLTEALVLLG